MHIFRFLFVLLISANIVQAQKVDGLLRDLKSAEDTSKVNILNKLSEAYSKVETKPAKKGKKAKPTPDKSYEYAIKALKLSEELKFKKGIALANFNLAKISLKKKDYRGAELYFLNSVELAKELKMHDLVLKNFDNIFKFHQELGNVSNAIAYANIKSEYKTVMINELREYTSQLSIERSKSLVQIQKLDSILKIKSAKEVETKKALARIPETVTVVETKKEVDYKIVGGALLLLVLMGGVTFLAVKEKNKKSRLLNDFQAKAKEIEKRLKETEGRKDHLEKDKMKLEKSKLKLSKEVNNLTSESAQMEMNLRTGQLLNQANFIVQKNEILAQLKANFNGLKESKIEEFSGKVMSIEKFLNSNFDAGKDWESFASYFESAYPELFTKLKEKFPNLSESEFRILAMQKVNLTSYEMSHILHLKEEIVEGSLTSLDNKIKG